MFGYSKERSRWSKMSRPHCSGCKSQHLLYTSSMSPGPGAVMNFVSTVVKLSQRTPVTAKPDPAAETVLISMDVIWAVCLSCVWVDCVVVVKFARDELISEIRSHKLVFEQAQSWLVPFNADTQFHFSWQESRHYCMSGRKHKRTEPKKMQQQSKKPLFLYFREKRQKYYQIWILI